MRLLFSSFAVVRRKTIEPLYIDGCVICRMKRYFLAQGIRIEDLYMRKVNLPASGELAVNNKFIAIERFC